MQPMAIPLRSVNTRAVPIRPFGRALNVRNVDINRTGEPERRPGMVPRLDVQRSGLGTLVMPFGGICGRHFPRLISIWPDGIHVDPSPGALEAYALDSFAATRGSSGDLSWTYFGGGTTPNENCEGVRILRRYDQSPEAHDDGLADIIYEGTAAVYVDSDAPDDEAVYYAAYAQYPDAAFSLGRTASLAQLLLYEDDFNRPDGDLANQDNPWVTDGLTILNGQVRAPDTDDFEGWSTVLSDVSDTDPITIRLTLVDTDGLWDIGLYDATNDRRIYARLEKAASSTLFVRNGVSNSDTEDDSQVPSANTTLTFRRNGDTITATHGDLTATIAWVPTDGVLYPFMAISGIAGIGNVRADNFQVRAE